jgi:hypothetical protein
MVPEAAALLADMFAGVVLVEGIKGYLGAVFCATFAAPGGPFWALRHQSQRGMLEQPLASGRSTARIAAARNVVSITDALGMRVPGKGAAQRKLPASMRAGDEFQAALP